MFTSPSVEQKDKVLAGLSRDGQVTTYFGTGFLAHVVSILTLKDFKTIVDTE